MTKMLPAIKHIGKLSNPEYAIVNISRPATTNPVGILALDFDKTLRTEDGKIINEDAIKAIIDDAYAKGFLIIINTGRKAEDISIRQIMAVIEKIGKGKISAIYFTNGKDKMPPLENLYQRYFYKDANSRRKICLVDDDIGYRLPCNLLGIETIPVGESNSYLTLLKMWINEIYDDHCKSVASVIKAASLEAARTTSSLLTVLLNKKRYSDAALWIDNIDHKLTEQERKVIDAIADNSIRENLKLRARVADYLRYEKVLENDFIPFSFYSHKHKYNAAEDLQRCLQANGKGINDLTDKHNVILKSKKLSDIYVTAKSLKR